MSLQGSPITSSKVWSELVSLAMIDGSKHIRELFESEPNRVPDLTFAGSGLTIDISRQRINSTILNKLLSLADDRGLAHARQAMFSGEAINNTENRSVLHTALRRPKNDSLVVNGVDVVSDVHSVLESMGKLAQKVRSGSWLGATGKPIKHVVNIGIGGSDLGPVMAYEALKPYSDRSISFHFVSNVDGADLFEVLNQVSLEQTLFIVASKTFTTQETMLNATSARNELFTAIGKSDAEVTARHFVAVSTNASKVTDFGIDPANMFGFWDWVGGRYSMDSAIGLSTMIAIGPDNFSEMLSGFYEMDQHFLNTDFEKNIPVLLGLIGLWNRSLLEINSVAVLPYDNYLKRFPAYLQQLTMESNGKSVTRDGQSVGVQTGAIYWGEPGTNGQHSFYQLLHQGTATTAIDIIYPAKSHAKLAGHHDVLISNALSQASVFAFGRTAQELNSLGVKPELVPHKVMPGNRPTTVITFDELTPKVLGSLVALYEHIVFVQGILWGINSFDQWGVELGKEVANLISPYLTNSADVSKFDQATQAAILDYRKKR